MSDPDPILAKARPLEALLLDSARDDAPPPELLGRTLVRMGVASAAAVATSAAATTASAAATTASVAVTAASAAAPVAAGGGLLGAIGIGALIGLLTVGFVDQVIAPTAPPERAPVAAAAPAAPRPVLTVVEVAPAPAPPPALTPATDSPQASSPPRAPSAAAASAARTGAATLPAEIALLDAARSALAAGDRARALAALDRHAREFPAGQLANEAAVLRAEASAGAAVSIP